jgi:hypothetical protein
VTDRPESKQAEKTYLSRTGGSAWEREKPFPPPGTELFDESLELLIPEFELSLDEWRSWTRLPRIKRPYRAFEKMARAMLEFFGGGKQSILFEEAFAMRLVWLLQVPVEEHPFIIAAKSDRRRTYPATWRAAIAVESLPSTARTHETVSEGATWFELCRQRGGDPSVARRRSQLLKL